jgi:adenosylcobinamide-phosphate guanylyltransferase
MCGGKGTRMRANQEKLLLKYKDPIIHHVISAMQNSSCFTKIVAATSHNAPRTWEFLTNLGVTTMDTAGRGYVHDLNQTLLNFDEPVFVTSGDMPLIDAEIIKKIIQLADTNKTWTTILISKDFLDSLHLKPEYTVIYEKKQYSYSGISIVNPNNLTKLKSVEESYVILDDKRIAFNLNTQEDYALLGTA